jgi:hypothetical protein
LDLSFSYGISDDGRHGPKWRSRNQSFTPPFGRVATNCEAAWIEYVVVHEMAHLRERNHNARFVGMMDRFMPKWRANREVLNRLPLRYEKWSY